jgi:hypothetical protein
LILPGFKYFLKKRYEVIRFFSKRAKTTFAGASFSGVASLRLV